MLNDRTRNTNRTGRKTLRNQLLALTLTGAMLSGSLLVPPGQAQAAVDPGLLGAAYMTDTDNWGGGAATSAADGDLDISLKNQNKQTADNYTKYPIDFKITGVAKKPVKSAQLLIRAYDVDEYKEALAASGEWDRVYFSSTASDIAPGTSYTTWPVSTQWNNAVKASGITSSLGSDSALVGGVYGINYKREMPQRAYLGTLSGQDSRWNTTVLSFSPSEFDRIGMGDNYVGVTIHHYYQDVRTTSSTPNTNWSMTIDWGQLVIDGGDRTTGEITNTGLKVENGKVTIDASFLPKVSGNNFAGEVNVIEKAVVNGQVIERNLGLQQKLFPAPQAGTEVNWNNIVITDSGIDPSKEYVVNVVLFDDRGNNGGAKDTTSGTNPGKAEHVVTFSTLDPVVQDFAKSGLRSDPTAFAKSDFQDHYFKLNGGAPNGTNLQSVRITELPDAAKGKLELNAVPVTAGQLIAVGDLPSLSFVPVPTGFDGTATFKWNGYNGTRFATDDATVTINSSPEVQDFVKVAKFGDLTLPITLGDFTAHYIDPGNESIEGVKIVTLPDSTTGKLALDNGSGSFTDITAGQELSLAQSSHVVFIPEAGATGSTSFQWNGSDGLQYAFVPKTVTIIINRPPVVYDIVKNGQKGTPTVFTTNDFAIAASYEDADGDALQQASISVPTGFASMGTITYTKSGASAAAIAPGQSVVLTASELATLTFTPAANLADGTVPTFTWIGNDGMHDSAQPAQVKINYNGIPTAEPVTFTVDEGTHSVDVVLQGSDPESSSDKLSYAIETSPAHGTLTADSVNPTGASWTYTPASGFTGTDSFTYTVTDEDNQKSTPATGVIHVQKPLDGWVGNKQQGDTTIVKAQPDQGLKLSAISSHLAASVTAKVDGNSVPLQLVNATTWTTDGYKLWENTTFVLPTGTTSGNHTVTFTAADATNPALQTESNDKLADNKFYIAAAGLPTAVPLVYTDDEGTVSINVTLQGSDPETAQNDLTYTIESDPSRGTLTKNATDLTGTSWIYTPAADFKSGTDSFTYTVTDEDAHKSTPAQVTIHVQKSLDGWVGNKQQGDPAVVKAQPDHGLQLSAISSHLASSVTATVDGSAVPLQLSNASTWQTDGYKLWANTTFVLPSDTTSGVHTVTFTAANAAGQTVQTESPVRLVDNKFYIAAAGLPTATALVYTDNEGVASINVTLQGSDPETAQNDLIYTIESGPSKGTLTKDPSDSTGTLWIYTPANDFTGTDTFTYTVTDEDGHKSTPAQVTIHIQKPLDGWVGDKQQGDTTIIKAQPDQGLKLSAISSHLAASVTAKVDGNSVPLQLVNATTWTTDGYKLWVNTTFVLPTGTTNGNHTVTFTAADAANPTLQTESNDKLADNKFYIAAAGLPTAVALVYTDNEGTVSINVKLQGSDPETSQNDLTYTIESDPSRGTLTKNATDLTGTSWIYTPAADYKSGTDSFTYTVTDEDNHKSAPAQVVIHLQKPLDGWVGDKQQGDPTVVKAQPDQELKLSAISSHLAASVTANVDGTPVSLQLANASTAETDGYKLWVNTTFVLPTDTASSNHTVTFTAADATSTVLQTESSLKLADNKFYVAAAGLPTAVPLGYTEDEGTTSINVALQGNDPETTQDKLIYTIESEPAKGTLTKDTSDPTGASWIYTPAEGFTAGVDSFTYTVTDEDDHKSASVEVVINLQKPLEGWVGDKEQGDPTVVKTLPEQQLKLSAISSHLAESVIANVDGTQVQLQLANASTWMTDGYKLWVNTTFTLPAATQSGAYTVTFTAVDAANTVLQTESQAKLADNQFRIAAAGLVLTADPKELLGDGKSTTVLRAVLTDEDGAPVEGVAVNFTAPAGQGTFIGGSSTVTDAKGQAEVTYQVPLITGVVEQQMAIQAVVYDPVKGLSAKDEIKVTFMPASVKGVVTKFDPDSKKNVPVQGASVRVTLDLNGDGVIEAGVDFDETVLTDEKGAYKVIVPKGNVVYNVDIIQPVQIGDSTKQVTYHQTAAVGTVSGAGEETFAASKTITGIAFMQQPDGSKALLKSDMTTGMFVYLKNEDGDYVSDNGNPIAFPVDSNGVFHADGLEVGNYELEFRYRFNSKEEIVIGKGSAQVSATGEMNIAEELIDPYGTITDADTNAVIENAKVVLSYADTERNKKKGLTAGALVTLPPIDGFAPNDNDSPMQFSDASGLYAYMVYPHTDYVITVSKDGYATYTSGTLSVETDIVRHDVQLRRPSIYVPPVVEAPKASLSLSVDANTVEEGGQTQVTVTYKNDSSTPLSTGQVKVTLPEGAVVVDAAGGKVEGNTIVWDIANVAGGQTGSIKLTVQWPLLEQAESDVTLQAQLSSSGIEVKASTPIHLYSDRFGELSHYRYILGYPDKEFKPNGSLTRAELAAIVARLTDNGDIAYTLPYTDIREGHWATRYIKIASKYGLFSGYQDGTFRPDAPVTRAELAAVMARFLKINVSSSASNHFKDTAGHWAGSIIETLYNGKFLTGYPDGSFKPNDKIKRAEAVTMINRMLYRGPLTGLAPIFPDMPSTHWAFGDVQEATVSHISVHNEAGGEGWKGALEDDVK
ncbi:tandem-95 repeat protein [Paenibacillus sp. PR3]|uniref:Tandem-95 repeat protein n=1 Tax=Paenibacillus terricola TaxID=2763503 RepID=A0ABR8MY46_9BACL|nr:tandem-95 repeat protein [Paenibacillus terricola]MBD3920873.1 tandem-95 repeat protein [Paenibacillus terricola]